MNTTKDPIKLTSKQVREQVGSILKEARPSLKLAFLFGSVAEGCTRPGSDIDLGVLDAEPLSWRSVADLMDQVGEATGWEVDVIDLYKLPHPITRSAVRGICLFGSEECYVDFCTRYLVEREDFGRLQDRIVDERLSEWIR